MSSVVIECLYARLPTMRETLKLLKPGGILHLETPDICSPLAPRGDADRAKEFYSVARKVPFFEVLVDRVRASRQHTMADQAEHIQLLARKLKS